MSFITTIRHWSEHAAFVRIAPFALYIAFLAAGPLTHGWAGFDARWFYAIQISVVSLVLMLFWRHYREINDGVRMPFRHWMVAIVLGAGVFLLWINLDQSWATMGESKGFNPTQSDGTFNWPLIVVRIAGAALVVPVMEELFWRSLVMRWIDKPDFLALAPAATGMRALLMSSVVFGFEHSLWLAGILAGLAYGGLYRWSGHLWAPVIAHSTTNLLLGIWVVSTGNWRFW